MKRKKIELNLFCVFMLFVVGHFCNLWAEVKVVVHKDNDLWYTDEFANNQVQLTNSPNYYKYSPRFSPDGKIIAFYSRLAGRPELWLVNTDGSNLVQFTNNQTLYMVYGDGSPAWSPDNQWIYFGSARSGDGEVWKIKIDGTNMQQLTNISGQNTQSFDVSPDGTKATFVRGVEGNGYTNKLYIDNSNFNNPVLIQSNYAPHIPRFSPDGLKIAYSDIYNTHIINTDGTGDIMIDSNSYPVTWHPSGNKLLISDASNLYWINIDGSNRTIFTRGDWASAVEITNSNNPPDISAGENINIKSTDISTTVIRGGASDKDAADTLQYRWKEDFNILLDWIPVDTNGECPLYIASTPLNIGTHTLTLEVTDGIATVTDDMILTIENSAPNAAPIGGGVYEIYTLVTLGGFVSDYDGDFLTYQWLEGQDVLFSGTIQTPALGVPVKLPDYVISNLGLGDHTLALQVNDGINVSVMSQIAIKIQDSTAPNLAPTANQTILWPPNHQMVNIVINAHAVDNSSQVSLAAAISSNEPISGLGDGDTAPDWTTPVINQSTGIITFQLRAERSGSGNGRIYTITFTATDNSNNISVAEIEIIVPHDKKK